jgi:ABC-type multidrug transport system permease subunit
MPMMLFSGLFINSENIPVYFDWIKYLSPMKYSFEGMFKTVMEGLLIPNGVKPEIRGEVAIAEFGFANDGLTIEICLAALAAMAVFLIILAYFALWRIVVEQGRAIPIKILEKGAVVPISDADEEKHENATKATDV